MKRVALFVFAVLYFFLIPMGCQWNQEDNLKESQINAETAGDRIKSEGYKLESRNWPQAVWENCGGQSPYA